MVEFSIGFVSLLGYIYGVNTLNGIGILTKMAIHTSTIFMVVAVSQLML